MGMTGFKSYKRTQGSNSAPSVYLYRVTYGDWPKSKYGGIM